MDWEDEIRMIGSEGLGGTVDWKVADMRRMSVDTMEGLFDPGPGSISRDEIAMRADHHLAMSGDVCI